MSNCAIVGINWGDEGKGRMVDYLTQQYDVVVRYQGGGNAGHTVINEKGKFALHLLPSGIFRSGVMNILGNGVALDCENLLKEIDTVRQGGVDITPENLLVSERASLLLPWHRELDALENVADSIHAVSDAMTEILGTTAMEADQKLDENRLQFKLAAAEARDAAAQLSPKEAAEAMRRKADEARAAARRASEISRLNAAEAAKAVKLAAKGTAERTAELLQLEQLAEELAARSEELRERTRRTAHFGKGRMLRAYPRLRHGTKQLTLDELRERLKYEHKHSA